MGIPLNGAPPIAGNPMTRTGRGVEVLVKSGLPRADVELPDPRHRRTGGTWESNGFRGTQHFIRFQRSANGENMLQNGTGPLVPRSVAVHRFHRSRSCAFNQSPFGMGPKTVKTGTVGDVISRGQVALATASHRCPRQVYDWAWRTSWSGRAVIVMNQHTSLDPSIT